MENNAPEVVDILLKHGANPNKIHKYHKMKIMDIALYYYYIHMIHVLDRYNAVWDISHYYGERNIDKLVLKKCNKLIKQAANIIKDIDHDAFNCHSINIMIAEYVYMPCKYIYKPGDLIKLELLETNEPIDYYY